LASAAELEGRLAVLRDDITAKRGALADRRLAAIATDRASWIERQ
jgi:hypothetical protein